MLDPAQSKEHALVPLVNGVLVYEYGLNLEGA